MDEQQSIVSQVFHNCTIIIHIGKEDFTDTIRDLVDAGIITRQVGEQLTGDENDSTS